MIARNILFMLGNFPTDRAAIELCLFLTICPTIWKIARVLFSFFINLIFSFIYIIEKNYKPKILTICLVHVSLNTYVYIYIYRESYYIHGRTLKGLFQVNSRSRKQLSSNLSWMKREWNRTRCSCDRDSAI